MWGDPPTLSLCPTTSIVHDATPSTPPSIDIVRPAVRAARGASERAAQEAITSAVEYTFPTAAIIRYVPYLPHKDRPTAMTPSGIIQLWPAPAKYPVRRLST